MKQIAVQFLENGIAENFINKNILLEGENDSIEVIATFPESVGQAEKRAYIHGRCDNSVISLGSENPVTLLLTDKQTFEGKVTIGFETVDEDTYTRFQPIQLEIESFVNLCEEAETPASYTVTVSIAGVETLQAGEAAYVENVGNGKDVALKFGLPMGPKGEKGDSINYAESTTPASYFIISSETDTTISLVQIQNTIRTEVTEIIIPSYIGGKKVMLENASFYSLPNLRRLVIPNTITKIGSDSFYSCTNLKEVVLPRSVTTIESRSFLEAHPDLTFYGYKGSAAESYAKQNSIPFKTLVESENDLADYATTEALNEGIEETEQKVVQVKNDVVSMLGTEIATLVGGKIPASQIPSIATTEIYHVASQAEMEALSVQRGDICIRTDEDKSYIYNESGWIYLASPTDYVQQAMYAETAGTAEDATKINGYRIITMTQDEYDAAVKETDTIYLVG